MAAPSLDGSVYTSTGNADPINVAVTVSSNANRYMLVGVTLGLNSAAGVTSVTANGDTVTLLKDSGVSANGQARALLYGLVAPDTGSYNVVVDLDTVSDDDRVAVVVATYKDVDQSTPTGTAVSAIIDSGNPTVNVTSASGETVVDVMSMRGAGSVPAVGAGQTQRANFADTSTFGFLGMSEEAGAGTVTMSWTGGEGFDSAICAVELKGVSAPPAATLEQEGYRGLNDDGSESAATFAAAQDAGFTVTPGVVGRFRDIINATGDPDAGGYQVDYRKQGETPWIPFGK